MLNIESALTQPGLKLDKSQGGEKSAEVLYSAYTSKGELLTDWVNLGLKKSGVVAVVFSGESGGAKTTIASQLIKEVTKSAGGQVFLTVITSGETVSRIERMATDYLITEGAYEANPHPLIQPVEDAIIKGINADFPNGLPRLARGEEFDRGRFGKHLWEANGDIMSMFLRGSIDKALAMGSYRGMRDIPRLVVADVAGIGKNGRLASKLNEVVTEYGSNTLFVVSPANPQIQNKALALRSKASQFLTELLQTRGVKPIKNEKGFDEIPITAQTLAQIKPLSPTETAQINAMLRKEALETDMDCLDTLVTIREGARPGRFEAARDIYYAEAINWAKSSDNALSRINKISAFLKEHQIISPNWLGLYAAKLGYAEEYMEYILGIPKKSPYGRVLAVPYLPETTIHIYSDFYKRKQG